MRQSFFRLPLDFSGRVTCLLVIGNKAIVGGEVTRNRPVASGGALPNPAVGTGVLIDIRDNSAAGTPDTVNFTLRPVPPTVCPAINSFQFRLSQGDFDVHAASTSSPSTSTSAQDETGGGDHPGQG